MSKKIKSITPVQRRGDRWTAEGGTGGWDVRIRYTDGAERLLCDGRAPYTLAQAQVAADSARRDDMARQGTTTTSIAAIRRALRDKFGLRMYRITAIGDIEAFGPLPNTDKIGWHLYGHIAAPETLHSLGLS